MTDQNQTIRADIAFMRQLAEEGRHSPITDGSFLLAAGLIFGAASLVQWWASTRGVGGWFVAGLWFGAVALFMVCLFILRRSAPRKGGTAGASGLAWSGAGCAIVTIAMSLMALGAHSHDWTAMAAMPSIVLAIYGGAWFVAAALSRTGWLYAVACGSFVMALVIGWFAAAGATVLLIYAASLFGLLALPGLVLMLRARRAA